MIEEIRQLLDRYVAWLRDKTVLRQINDKWVEITTPYLDRHNDCLQIYARRAEQGYVLTDDGQVLQDLQMSECGLEGSRKRQALLEMTLNGFGVQLNNNAIEVRASKSDFGLRKHNLIQAMLAVSDLFYLAKPMVARLFYEDVVSWLDLREIRYTPNIKFSGKSGYDHMFHFVIPKSRAFPERILKAISTPSRDTAESMVFSWLDTREVRPADSRAYAILNDTEETVAAAVLEALQQYAVRPVVWSEREKAAEELAA
jgi:hypothetical protein